MSCNPTGIGRMSAIIAMAGRPQSAAIGAGWSALLVQIGVALRARAIGMPWLSLLIEVGALVGLTTVILVLLYGQSRIFATMANDGLLPPVFARIHPRHGTPWISQLVIGAGVAIVAATTPIDR